MTPTASRARAWAGLGLALLGVLLAAGLRFHRLDAQSYWNDEGNTRALVSRDLPTLLRNTAADIHPPGYYLALQAWRAGLGESEFALRAFSALAGLALVALVARLGREWLGWRAGLAAAGLAAAHPFLIYYSQEARMYALLAAVGAASCLALGRLWRRPDWDPPALAGLALTTALGLYTHYAFGFVILSQAAAVGLALAWGRAPAAAHPRPRLLLKYLLSLGLAGLLYLPWLPTAYHQLTGWPAAREFHPLSEALLDLARLLAFGRTLPTGEALWGLAAAAALAALGAVLAWERRSKGPAGARAPWALIVLAWLLVPAGLTLSFGLLTEAFSKFLLAAVPAVCLLLGAAFARPPGSAPLRRSPAWIGLAAWPLALVLLAVTGQSLANLYFNPAYFRDDYRGIAGYILGLGRPGDAVITNAPNQAEAFDYYLRSDLPGRPPLYPLPDSRPLDPDRTTAQLVEIAARHDRIFVLYWGDAQADPGRFIEGWLTANTFTAGDRWFGQVRLATYAAARPAAAPAVHLAARFGEHIQLQGYTLNAADLQPGDIIQLTLFWRTDAPLTARYKVFVHLYADPEAPPLAQQDGEPGGGLALTSAWEAGRTYADNHGLLIPPDLPPGSYRLMAGLYDLNTGGRLAVSADSAAAGDRLDLGPVVVR